VAAERTKGSVLARKLAYMAGQDIKT